MGMFDTIIYESTECHQCSEPVVSYQSKDGNCELQDLTPAELLEQSGESRAHFYGYCHDDDWNNGQPHHRNEFTVLSPQEARVVRGAGQDVI